MFAIFNRFARLTMPELIPGRFLRRCPRITASTLRAAAVMICLEVAAPDGTSVAADLGSDKQPTSHAVDDALTRESMADLNRAEPVSPPVTPMIPLRPTPSRVHARMDPKDFVPRHHGARHLSVAKKGAEPVQRQVVAHSNGHRNPAARFVYWSNGWVIRTFHTKVGTVLLGTVGAKT